MNNLKKDEKRLFFIPSKPNILYETTLNAQVLVNGSESGHAEKRNWKQIVLEKVTFAAIAVLAAAGSGFLVNWIIQVLQFG